MLEVDKSTRFKSMLIMTAFIVLLFGALYFISYPDFFGLKIPSIKSLKPSEVNTPEVLSVQTPSVFEEVSKPIYGFPVKLNIEPVGIEVDIVSVGVDTEGFLETPEKWNEAGWYVKGAKPSEIGNFLINAHYDDSSGRPAAFWNLKNINIGDKVSVLDSYNRTFVYVVTNVCYVDINDPERSKVFKPYVEDKSLMTLITCGGVWSIADGTYSKRLVVNAELIQ